MSDRDVRDALATVLYNRLFFGKWVMESTAALNLARTLAEDLMNSDKMQVGATEPSKLELVNEGVRQKRRALAAEKTLQRIQAFTERHELAGEDIDPMGIMNILENK